MKQSDTSETFEQVLKRRCSRRTALKGLAGAAAVTGGSAVLGLNGCTNTVKPGEPLTFKELPHGYDHTHHVADGYNAEILIRWGDPVFADAPDNFSGGVVDADSQLQQFGYNNDFIGFLPLPLSSNKQGSNKSDHGLLCVNHEYTIAELMFPSAGQSLSQREQAEIEMAAHGHSVIEIKKLAGRWQVIKNSKYNRRISAHTEMQITGPAAGHSRLQTNADPTGRTVFGTLNNCAGGITPWGTVLIAEENFQGYFNGDIETLASEQEKANYLAFGAGSAWYNWHQFHRRFDIEREPHEFNRFGWMVELDPYDPTSTPKKRTALGRFCHEGATIVAEHRKPVVAYSGDDGKNQFIYKFISSGVYDKHNRRANMDLLADGTLYVARFHDNGVGEWLQVSGDDSAQGLIDTRIVAKKIGATPMDRPEDIETNPVTGRTYVMLTNNNKRTPETTDAVNPRANNKWGQIVEILPPGSDGNRDHLAPYFQWEMFVLAGDPNHPEEAKQGRYHPATSEHGWFANPDNLAFDPAGRMWISTDGLRNSLTADGQQAPVHDGVWACETTGEQRALTRHFFGCPKGAEACGPCFTPDGETFFVAVQHPGHIPGSDYHNPGTRWPDFAPNNPPRPSVVVITKKGGGVIGG